MQKGEFLYKGKAKSLYRTDEDGVLLVEFRDDITAFDGGKKDVIPSKGRLNAQVSAYLFRLLEENGIPTHFIDMPDETHMRVKALEMIPIEVIVRNIAAGSMARQYPIKEGTVLDPPVIVIDYKDDARHDPMLNDDLVVALGLLSREELAAVKETALRVNSVLKDFFASLGIVLVDFKLEFGRSRDGRILLGDEISMDSMRLWELSTGESLDKDVYRFSKGDVGAVYSRVAEKICAGKGRARA
ncbi:MAG: phosphoribosylaminoimidazolesuccinocarboxamide synthase [Methanolinea sp.]|nr:phosphoribosylaminoimidazolesuccinocarboxamide synthase [Methanolinea sp.]